MTSLNPAPPFRPLPVPVLFVSMIAASGCGAGTCVFPQLQSTDQGPPAASSLILIRNAQTSELEPTDPAFSFDDGQPEFVQWIFDSPGHGPIELTCYLTQAQLLQTAGNYPFTTLCSGWDLKGFNQEVGTQTPGVSEAGTIIVANPEGVAEDPAQGIGGCIPARVTLTLNGTFDVPGQFTVEVRSFHATVQSTELMPTGPCPTDPTLF